MKNEIQIASKFEPLFDLLDDNAHKGVDTVILTGGRMSSKSFNVALLTLIGAVEASWKVLFTRFTNTSIRDSIKMEVSEKIEVLNYEPYVTDTQNRIEAVNGDGFISFKGIKTGSKGQTANLKSLSGFNIFVVDEAEEIPDYDTFKKVYYSIRSKDKRNLSILILNPTTKEHWIYREFYENKVKDGFCGVVDNVLYIHSSYLDVNPEYVPENILRDYERLKERKPNEYYNVVMGGWIEESEGAVFKKSELNWFNGEIDKSQVEATIGAVDPAGDGADSTCAPLGHIIGNKIFIDEVIFCKYGTQSTIPLVAEMLNRHLPEYVRVETNMGSGMYLNALKDHVNESVGLLGIRATSNKHTRIITMAYFIKQFCVFRDDYEYDSPYHNFIRELTAYDNEKSENEHDDAPDGMEMIAKMAKTFYSHLWESETE
jgi:predicted phage terminase large subunit-like protein